MTDTDRELTPEQSKGKVLIDLSFFLDGPNEIDDTFGSCGPQFYIENGKLYQQWVVRPGKIDSDVIGEIYEPVQNLHELQQQNLTLTTRVGALESIITKISHYISPYTPSEDAWEESDEYTIEIAKWCKQALNAPPQDVLGVVGFAKEACLVIDSLEDDDSGWWCVTGYADPEKDTVARAKKLLVALTPAEVEFLKGVGDADIR